MDFNLNRELIKQTPLVTPAYASRNERRGLGTLHHICEEISNVVTKHLFQIGDHMRLANCSFAEAYQVNLFLVIEFFFFC